MPATRHSRHSTTRKGQLHRSEEPRNLFTMYATWSGKILTVNSNPSGRPRSSWFGKGGHSLSLDGVSRQMVSQSKMLRVDLLVGGREHTELQDEHAHGARLVHLLLYMQFQLSLMMPSRLLPLSTQSSMTLFDLTSGAGSQAGILTRRPCGSKTRPTGRLCSPLEGALTSSSFAPRASPSEEIRSR